MPYLIEPPLTERRMFDVGDALEFSVVLIGKATVYWKLLIFAIKRLGQTGGIGRRVDGRRGRFQLKRVDSVGLFDRAITVYSADGEFNHDPPITLTEEEVEQAAGPFRGGGQKWTDDSHHVSRFTFHDIRFLTPVCLIENIWGDTADTQKRLMTELDFATVMRELLRRLSDLSETYCDGPPLDFTVLLESAVEVQTAKSFLVREDMERYSRRQGARHPMGGVKGVLRLEGDLEPFLPYLRLGEWLHLGRKTTFGLGQYQIMEVEK